MGCCLLICVCMFCGDVFLALLASGCRVGYLGMVAFSCCLC